MRRKRKNRSNKDILFDKAWSAFRGFILERDKNICITCGQLGNMGGHFIHGKHKPTYFDEQNVHCQCSKCNFFLDGNRDVYLRKIQLKYGIEKGDELLGKKHLTKYWTIEELQKILDYYNKNK